MEGLSCLNFIDVTLSRNGCRDLSLEFSTPHCVTRLMKSRIICTDHCGKSYKIKREPEVSNTEHYMEQSIVDISFKKPNSNNIVVYWLFHSHQPTNKIPFTADKAYKQKDGSYRKWLSYSTKDKALFCNTCIAYERIISFYVCSYLLDKLLKGSNKKR
ncbi:Hypothetical protein CINCED_3A010439 [Cinara cedri]|uniref:Uncharacterized protein n=1 Tax=Cinara cedri TaxID=506608 RepID=A0A5E4MFV6_9HEMI|nr:Hypothetical protein CINCED_3A010439 [Cinara cedri]